ncbi:PREDICTED: cytochrome P450 CYP72A219-like [Ipomoea nil]|uniref:cytochrome P450 CYP72A219-like n=1 Tax=Ipomoea nil TaxID=35883 RepID=UPI0009009384|nr:PREDICTED: cytochrome P450 CYP72A219-like [Ipomoea nil]
MMGMEVFCNLFLFSFSIMFLVCAWRVVNWAWIRPKTLEKWLRGQDLKGNPYRLFYGDTKEIAKMMNETKSKPMNVLSDEVVPRVIPYFFESIQKHGKNSFVWLGTIPMVIITDPDHVKEVLSKHNTFQQNLADPVVYKLSQGLLKYEGDKWSKHRKIANPAFQLEKLKHMVPAMYKICSEMVGRWEEIVSRNESGELDVWPELKTIAVNVISLTAFGISYETGRRLFELQHELAEHASELRHSVYIPGGRFLPTKKNRRMNGIDKEINTVLKRIIEKRIGAMKEGEEASNNLLDMLLESNFKEMKHHGNQEFGMSIEDIISECKLFYLAGQETTSDLLVWTMILLSRNQEWQELAREEVMHVFGDDKPDFDGLNRLKIVTMILNESLRLYPPVPTLIRIVKEDAKLGNLSLPAGVRLLVPIIFLHHDPEMWGEDANEFNPERFREGVSKATNGKACYLPFSGGPRICIGLNFAMVEAKTALSCILRRFSFKLSPSYAHAPYTGLTTNPLYGAPLILQKL